MIGPRIGLRIGPRIGPAIGISADHIGSGVDPMAGVTKDALKGIYRPQNSSEWTTTLAAAGLGIGVPKHGYGFQQGSGDAIDKIGSVNLTLTGTPTFGASISGASTTGVAFIDNGTDVFSSTSATLPDISVTKVLLIAYIAFTSSGGNRSMFGAGTTSLQAQTTSTPRYRCASGANVLAGTAAIPSGLAPVVISSHTGALYSLNEVITPTAGALTGKQLRVAAFSANSPAFTITDLWQFEGTDAQLTQAQIKTLLQTLAWAPVF